MSSVTFPFSVTIKTGKKKNEFIVDKSSYTIHLKAQPTKGKANKELIHFLSKHLKTKVRITSGFKSRTKTIDII